MKKITSFGLILAVVFISSVVIELLNIEGLPLAVFALIFLFVLLLTGLLKTEWLEEAGGVMLKHMGLLFVPLGVRIVSEISLLEGMIVRVFATVILSTLITQAAVLAALKLMKRYGGGQNGNNKKLI